MNIPTVTKHLSASLGNRVSRAKMCSLQAIRWPPKSRIAEVGRQWTPSKEVALEALRSPLAAFRAPEAEIVEGEPPASTAPSSDDRSGNRAKHRERVSRGGKSPEPAEVWSFDQFFCTV
jgi:hypothetical protein